MIFILSTSIAGVIHLAIQCEMFKSIGLFNHVKNDSFGS